MSWEYEQATGRLIDPMGLLVATGYAGGNCGINPEGVNNPSMQGVRSVGPLPVGLYTLGEPVPQSHLGPFAIPLIPDAENDMLGRGDFYMHGDRTNAPGCASEGCIIMPRAVRNKVWASEDHTLKVIKE
jgi:hypothetical protein